MTDEGMDPSRIVTVCRECIPFAERSAQDAFEQGDMETYRKRLADARWYRDLLEQYGMEDAA